MAVFPQTLAKGVPVDKTLSRKALRAEISSKPEEAQEAFRQVNIYYSGTCEPQLRELKEKGLIATAYEFESRYLGFVDSYHFSRSNRSVPRFYTSYKQLLRIRDEWSSFIANIKAWNKKLVELSNPDKEQQLRATITSKISEINEHDARINGIISAHIAALRSDSRDLLKELAQILPLKYYWNEQTLQSDFEELNKLIKDLTTLESKLRPIRELLVYRYS